MSFIMMLYRDISVQDLCFSCSHVKESNIMPVAAFNLVSGCYVNDAFIRLYLSQSQKIHLQLDV
jgi:hypothetical protein